jgi:hypothetical protein
MRYESTGWLAGLSIEALAAEVALCRIPRPGRVKRDLARCRRTTIEQT